MASKVSEGDAVQVVDREPTANDEKSGCFYGYFRGLTGTLEKLYQDGMATVVLDEESLPEPVLKRHHELTEGSRKKWLDGLSAEARGRLTTEEKEFRMRYTILVNATDLVSKGSAKTAPKNKRNPAKAEDGSAAAESGASRSSRRKNTGQERVVSAKDLDRAEEEFLKARQATKDK